MAHTRNQELESCFNTLQHGLLETQQEVQQLVRDNASLWCILECRDWIGLAGGLLRDSLNLSLQEWNKLDLTPTI